MIQNNSTYKEPGKCDPFSRDKQATNANPKITQMLELPDKNSETAIITMFQDIKKMHL